MYVMKRIILLFTSLLILSAAIPAIVYALGQQTQKCFTVVDETGEPVVGATARVKDTNRSNTTDMDGKICISAMPHEIIEISYVGYRTTEVLFGSITPIYTVRLSLDEL